MSPLAFEIVGALVIVAILFAGIYAVVGFIETNRRRKK